MKQPIYLDHAAATPVDPQVLKAMQPYFSDNFYNPSATYLAAKQVSGALNQARSTVAQWLGARPAELVFTAGGTEANNLAIQGVMQHFPGANLVISAIEHESVIKPAKNYPHKIIRVDESGVVDLKNLSQIIDDRTVLVGIMYANNEIGTIQPTKEIAKLISTIRQKRKSSGNELPLYFHIDACQAANYLDLHVDSLGVDLMTINGGKVYGPKQSGVLYIKTGVQLSPQILGGGQENSRRSGTENVPAIIGLAKALDLAQTKRHQEGKRLSDLQKYFVEQINKTFPKAKINGSLSNRLANNIHVTFPGTDNERLMMQLDEMGIMCAVGSACSASNEEPSHVLKAIGLSDKAAQSSLRITMGQSTTKVDVDSVIQAVLACL